MFDVLQRLNELERRIANVFLIGSVIEADYDNALIKVQSGELITGWLNWITTRAGNDIDWWAPEIGEQVVVMSPNGDPELGIVLPAIYQNKFPAPANKPTVRRTVFEDGTSVQYDKESHLLTIDVKGDIALKNKNITNNSDSNIKISAGGNIALTAGGDVTVTTPGNFKVNAARIDLN